MASPKFFFDQDVPRQLTQAIRLHEPAVDILCVGEPGATPFGTPDPQNLLAAETMERILLTRDKKTMPGHLQDHHNAGHHTWGVLMMKRGHRLKRFFDELMLIWGATNADEWRDVPLYIPSTP